MLLNELVVTRADPHEMVRLIRLALFAAARPACSKVLLPRFQRLVYKQTIVSDDDNGLHQDAGRPPLTDQRLRNLNNLIVLMNTENSHTKCRL